MGRHYFENGQRELGLKTLSDSNWLLDVPRFERPPVVDGRLEEEVWSHAVESTPFFAYSSVHNAAVRSKVQTVMFAGYTHDALYLATRCEDAHPESLIVVGSERDYGNSDLEDVVEYFFDTNFDRKTFVRATVNSGGAILPPKCPPSTASAGFSSSSYLDRLGRLPMICGAPRIGEQMVLPTPRAPELLKFESVYRECDDGRST